MGALPCGLLLLAFPRARRRKELMLPALTTRRSRHGRGHSCFAEIALTDTLAQDNTVQRSRALAQLIGVALRILESGEQEDKLAILESALGLA